MKQRSQEYARKFEKVAGRRLWTLNTIRAPEEKARTGIWLGGPRSLSGYKKPGGAWKLTGIGKESEISEI